MSQSFEMSCKASTIMQSPSFAAERPSLRSMHRVSDESGEGYSPDAASLAPSSLFSATTSSTDVTTPGSTVSWTSSSCASIATFYGSASSAEDAKFAKLAYSHRPPLAIQALSDTWNNRQESHIPSSSDGIATLDGSVLLVGGYRGSVLKDAKGKRVWITLGLALGVRKGKFDLVMSDEDEASAGKAIHPTKMLTSIIGLLDSGNTLKKVLKTFHAKGDIHFFKHGYDWRLNFAIPANLLLERLQALKEATGHGATIICHSMGGLVVLHALAIAHDPTVFRAILFAGTPFQGSIGVVHKIRRGESVGLAKKAGHPDKVFATRSPYYLLPRDNNGFRTPDGTSLGIDLLDPETWADLHLSPTLTRALAASKTNPRSSPEYSHLHRTLKRVERFHQDLEGLYDESKACMYPPMAILASKATPTVDYVVVNSHNDIRADNDYTNRHYCAGDGYVSYKSMTQLPGKWGRHVVSVTETDRGHVGMLGDLRAVSRATIALTRAVNNKAQAAAGVVYV